MNLNRSFMLVKRGRKNDANGGQHIPRFEDRELLEWTNDMSSVLGRRTL